MELGRRGVLVGGAALAFTGCAPKARPALAPIANGAIAELEQKSGGRLGVFILDTGSGEATGYRSDERFGMCSTFKMGLAAVVLWHAEKRVLDLQAQLSYSADDMVPNSPVTRENLAKGAMSIVALAEATQKTSDNTAANLLIKKLGGPAALTGISRGWGDTITRFDRFEPEMNNVPTGEVRDTTSPQAFAQTMAKLLASNDILAPASREQLIQWMIDTKTGSKRIRAGLPAGWKSGDKTGTANSSNYNNKTNDVAVFWPPSRPPVIVTAYYEANGKYDEIRDADQAVLAEVGRIAAAQAVEWHGGLD